MSKSLPERLREASTEATARCFDVSATVCALRYFMANIDACDAISVQAVELGVSCDGMCLRKMLDLIADEIERDYVRIPDFRYEASRDAFIRHMRFIREENIVTCVSESVDPDSFEEALGTQPIERIFSLTCVGKPWHDTLEDISEDSKLSVVEYCRKHKHVQISHNSVTRDLLRRQREVLGRDGE